MMLPWTMRIHPRSTSSDSSNYDPDPRTMRIHNSQNILINIMRQLRVLFKISLVHHPTVAVSLIISLGVPKEICRRLGTLSSHRNAREVQGLRWRHGLESQLESPTDFQKCSWFLIGGAVEAAHGFSHGEVTPISCDISPIALSTYSGNPHEHVALER